MNESEQCIPGDSAVRAGSGSRNTRTPLRRIVRHLLLASVLAPGGAPLAQAAACRAESGAHTTALVELFTSEGCSSCPPADRWLSAFAGDARVPQRIVPVAFHVDYWDYIGWKDPFARRAFSQRQRERASLSLARTVYTPQVVVHGMDLRRWRSGSFDAAVASLNAQPSRAQLALQLHAVRARELDVEVRAKILDASVRGAVVLYLAVYEGGLQNDVGAGENAGKSLRHDYVARDWLGPFALPDGEPLMLRRTLKLPEGLRGTSSGVLAFVERAGGTEVLQALMLPACAG